MADLVLETPSISRMFTILFGVELYHFEGLMLDIVKKQAVVGCPIPSIDGTSFLKKSGGGSRGIALASSGRTKSVRRSLRTARIVATMLPIINSYLILKEREGGEFTWLVGHPTSMGQE